MLVLLTRAIDQAKRTAARLENQGHQAMFSPIVDMVPTGALWPAGVVDGVIATSARAFELFSDTPEWPAPEARRLMPLFLVGERTREAAKERGFEGPARVAPNAKALCVEIYGETAGPGRLIYLAGRDRKSDLEDYFTERGYLLELIEVYAALPAEALNDTAVASLAAGEIGAVLHYSRHSTDIFLGLARRAGLDLSRVNHVCISSDAAAPLMAAGIHEVLIAKTPDERAMFAIVNALAGLPEPPLGPGEIQDLD
jgi:uroporphyrinogen-III synthase